MRQLAPAEVLLKATAVGDPAAAPSVLTGAVVRVLIDKVGGLDGRVGLSGFALRRAAVAAMLAAS